MILFPKIQLTEEQYRNLDTTPVEVIPSPGEGKAIQVVLVDGVLGYEIIDLPPMAPETEQPF